MGIKNTVHVRRRQLILAGLGVAGIAGSTTPLLACAEPSWPSRPITIVVPFSPGGSNDMLARLLANKLGERFGISVVVENKGGAGGTIGTERVTRAAPDGYTLLFCSASITTNVATGKVLHYNLVKDLQPIGAIATSPFVVVVSNDLSVKTLAEFIDYAKMHPGAINYGSAGVGGINHLATELLAHIAGIKLNHVAYKGMGGAFTDLMGGRLQMLLPSVATAAAYIHDGRMRGLAVTGGQRSGLLPNLPTMSEAGLPDFKPEAWYGILGPAGMPATVVHRLNAELNAILNTPEIRKQLAFEGATATPGVPDALGSLIKSEIERWKNLIKSENLEV